MRKLIAVALVAELILGAAATAQRRRTQPASPSPQAYAASVADVNCANVVQRRAGLRPLFPLIRSAIRNGTLDLQKDEFETTAAFRERQAAHYSHLFGGTDKLVIAYRPRDFEMSYNADRETMNISLISEDLYHYDRLNFRQGYLEREDTIQLFRDNVGSSFYQGSNAFGATRSVQRTDKVRAALLIPRGQISRLPPLSMPPAQARLFNANPLVLVVATLRPPYFNHAFDRIRATIDYPYETRLNSHAIAVNIQCIVVVAGDTEVYRLLPRR